MMWDKIIKLMTDYNSATITGVDENGYPVSVRCKPKPDHDAKVLRCEIPDTLGLQADPASLLCHSHDEWLFNMTSFGVRGTIEREENGWLLRPKRLVPGAGLAPTDLLNLVRNGRRGTKKYLDKRGLSRPKIPWKTIQDSYIGVSKKGK